MTPDEVVLERMFRGVGLFYGRCAEVSPGGSAVDLDGVRAAVVPALPYAWQPRDELDWIADPDPAEVATVVDASYGFPAGTFARGCEVSSLQASNMGHPVYRRLGYRDLGRAELWERRAQG